MPEGPQMNGGGTELGKYLNSIATLGFSTAAAVLSATILKNQLIPVQFFWLGAEGSVVAAVMLVLVFALRYRVSPGKTTRILCGCLVGTMLAVIILETGFVKPVSYQNQTCLYLVGWHLSKLGETEERKWSGRTDGRISDEKLIELEHPERIPVLYGWTYTANKYIYIFSYLGLLAAFVLLVGGIELRAGPPQ